MESAIERLLQNKNKAKILTFFLIRPERGFHFMELKRRLRSIRKLDSELTGLVKVDILRTNIKRGVRYYRLNGRHAWYGEMKNWAKKIKRVAEDDLARMLKKVPGVRLAALSGFLAGNNKLECDLLLIGKIPQKKLNALIKRLEKFVANEVNYAVMDFAEFNYRKNTFDRFMKDVFENDHIVLIDRISAAANKN